MPRHLKLIARFANSGLVILCLVAAIGLLSKGNLGATLFMLAFGVLLAFNLYLIEKAAVALSEEEWLKAEVRKVLLRRKLRRMATEDPAGATDVDKERTDADKERTDADKERTDADKERTD